MSIICFEGASAVGKTTTANCFKAKYDAFVVPEVNQLFARPDAEPPAWYFERQVERWSIAREQAKTHELVILDGDPFQPLWYNWAYNFKNRQNPDFMERFYRPEIRSKRIDFPDLYFIFSAGEIELRKRRAGDAGRQRRGFETHLQMIAPQRRYFQAMQTFSANRVLFREAKSVESNIEFVRERARVSPIREDSEALFDRLIRWLRENKP